MKIGFISYEFPPDTGKGGIGTYVSQIAAAMAACGMDVHVFAGSNERTSTKLMNGYKVHRVQCNNGFAVSNFAIFYHGKCFCKRQIKHF